MMSLYWSDCSLVTLCKPIQRWPPAAAATTAETVCFLICLVFLKLGSRGEETENSGNWFSIHFTSRLLLIGTITEQEEDEGMEIAEGMETSGGGWGGGGGGVAGQVCISSVDSQPCCYHCALPFSLSPSRRYWPIARDYRTKQAIICVPSIRCDSYHWVVPTLLSLLCLWSIIAPFQTNTKQALTKQTQRSGLPAYGG